MTLIPDSGIGNARAMLFLGGEGLAIRLKAHLEFQCMQEKAEVGYRPKAYASSS